jgi:hypothetical protein
VENPPEGVIPEDFNLDLTDSSGFEFAIPGQPPPACAPPIPVSPNEGDMSPGVYEITERVLEPSEVLDPDRVEVDGDCEQVDPPNDELAAATGEIQEGESKTCTFINTYLDS